ncbi:FkbM family methyltransferase [Bradyrhizobium sp. 159]|uniref:FkbM family methyltransferase n=1 Tax=Bradyrhizobium sp. 159 TaxID=2782632 RepID=UPI001FFC241F|nr:FkbM family methyltransferase [Bradyrhizobium sp. 159]MCK1619036.1 FkbM family methyltransferase [Bradyrhizobium sp. 159]
MAALEIVRAQAALSRIGWGAREIGLKRIIAGLARLGLLIASRPSRAEITTTNSGLRIAFNCRTQLMPLLIVFQELLEPELDAVQRLLGPSAVAIDVGASIGTWTLWAAKTGATVYACEPDAQNLTMLMKNVRSNGLEANVIAHSCALGPGEGWSTANGQAGGYGLNFKLAASVGQPCGGRVQSLDHFVREIGVTRVDVLKVNTAGCEADVLAGGIELFRQQKVGTAMFLDGLEVRPRLDELRQFSYELGFYDGHKRQFLPVGGSNHLDNLRPGPANRYVVVKHASVSLCAPNNVPSADHRTL